MEKITERGKRTRPFAERIILFYVLTLTGWTGDTYRLEKQDHEISLVPLHEFLL